MKKKQILVLSVLCGLLLVTGYLNFKFNNTNSTIIDDNGQEGLTSSQLPEHDAMNVNASSTSFFSQFKVDREAIREKEMSNIDSVINDENTTEDVLKQAQEQKLELSNNMEKEVTVEGLLSGIGFSDAVVTIRENSVNVVVNESEIDEQKAAQILELVMRETGQSAANIKILPTNG